MVLHVARQVCAARERSFGSQVGCPQASCGMPVGYIQVSHLVHALPVLISCYLSLSL